MVTVEIKLRNNEFAAIVESPNRTMGPIIIFADSEETIRGYVRSWERAGHSVQCRRVYGKSFRATADAERPGAMVVMGGLRLDGDHDLVDRARQLDRAR